MSSNTSNHSQREVPSVDRLTTVTADGARHFLHPASVRGRFTNVRRAIGWALMLLLFVLPFITINGAPAIWLDLEHRRFHVLGLHLLATDSDLLFFLLTGVAFVLVVTSALFGRVWCGYACPQTVFLEQLYRPIERFFEGDREQQIRLDRAPMSFNKVWRKGGKNAAFVAVSVLLAHLFIAYFVSVRSLASWILKGPSAEPAVFATIVVVSAILYGNYAWFREQLCIVLCPYGRLQSVLTDQDTIVVGYDSKRGEPRGKGADAGACVDCLRCVAVCPTGIDIRQGFQLECVGCTGCIDACDNIMDKLKRPRGLIRYESLRVLQGEPTRRYYRPRLLIYAVLAVLGLSAFIVTRTLHRPFGLALLRQPGAPFVLVEEEVRNSFVVKVENANTEPVTLHLNAVLPEQGRVVLLNSEVVLAPGELRRVPVVISAPKQMQSFAWQLSVGYQRDGSPQEYALSGWFVAPH